MTFSETIADWLAEKGITHAFGIIGGGNVTLWAALAAHPKITVVATHHEQAAAMAATYYYRVSGKMALTIVTTGAGSANAITGLMAAWMDSMPLLVISGNEATRYHNVGGRGWGFQGYDSSAFVKPYTNRAMRMFKSDEPTHILDMCLKSALTPRQGPVWIDIPKDVQGAMAA